MTRTLSVALLLGILSAAFAGTAAAAGGPTFTTLGTIQNPDGTFSNPNTGIGWAVNASGQAVGYATVYPSLAFQQLHPGPYPGLTHGFVSGGGSMTDLTVNGLNGNLYTPTPPDGNVYGTDSAYGINNNGTIVGVALNTALGSNRAFVTSGGSMMSMDAYDATIGQSRAYGVSASGEAVGMGYFATNQWHAFTYNYSGTYNPTTAVYSGGSWSYTDVNSLLCAATGAGSGGCSEALAVNSANMVTGFATQLPNQGISVGSLPQAYVLNSGGTVTLVPIPSGMTSTYGEAINNKGDVAGYTSNVNVGTAYPMLAVNNGGGYTAINLGTPAGNYGSCYGYNLNDYDMVVGVAYNNTASAYEGYLWTTGVVPFYGLSVGANDLNTLAASVLPSGWSVTTVRGINDAGQIVGSAANGSTSYAIMLSLPQAVPGDANLDGKVDINDLTIVLAHYNDSVNMNWGTGDFTGSGKVDINDLTIVLAHYNQTAGTAASFSVVPEPGSLLLLVLAALGVSALARRRP